MLPDRRGQLQALDAAQALQQLLATPSFSHLLQQPPPTQLTAGQAAVMATCSASLKQLELGLASNGTAPTQQLLHALLNVKAVHKVGTLLAWLQQQPQPLQLARLKEQLVRGNTLEAVWLLCCSIMRKLTVGIVSVAAADATPLVVTFTQQLRQSGAPRQQVPVA
jgi:hypothetical protein